MNDEKPKDNSVEPAPASEPLLDDRDKETTWGQLLKSILIGALVVFGLVAGTCVLMVVGRGR
jgi:hypothetical protein